MSVEMLDPTLSRGEGDSNASGFPTKSQVPMTLALMATTSDGTRSTDTVFRYSTIRRREGAPSWTTIVTTKHNQPLHDFDGLGPLRIE